MAKRPGRKSEYERVRTGPNASLAMFPHTKSLLDDLHYRLRESRVQILSYAVKEYHARVMAEAKSEPSQPQKQGVKR